MQRRFAIISFIAVALAAILGSICAKYRDLPPDFVVRYTALVSIKMGERHPTSAVWVYAQKQNKYIVVLHGHFGGYPHMPKGAVFNGTVAEIIMDANRRVVDGEGILNKEVDLSPYGTTHWFLSAVQDDINHVTR